MAHKVKVSRIFVWQKKKTKGKRKKKQQRNGDLILTSVAMS